MASYRISAGNLDSILDTRGDRTGHASVRDAILALAAVTPYDADDLATEKWPDGEWAVYRSREDADGDSDGSSAMAVISPEAE